MGKTHLIGTKEFAEASQKVFSASGIDEANNLRDLKHFFTKSVGIVERIGVSSVIENLEQSSLDVGLDNTWNQIRQHVSVQFDGTGDLDIAKSTRHPGPERQEEVDRVVAGVPVAQRRAGEVRNQIKTRRELRCFHQFGQLEVRLDVT